MIICFMINASIIAVKTIMLYGAISLEGITGIIMAGVVLVCAIVIIVAICSVIKHKQTEE